MDQLCLVQSVDDLGQGVIVSVATTAHRVVDTGLDETLSVTDEDVL